MDATIAAVTIIRHRETTDNATRGTPGARMIMTGEDGTVTMKANTIMVTGREIGEGKETAVIGHIIAFMTDTTTEDNTAAPVARTEAQGL